MRVKELMYWIEERQSIYAKKEARMSKPWTDDPILQSYRFCCPYRENDAVTKWIAQNWRDPNRKDQYLFFAMTIARLINKPETLEALGYPDDWIPNHFIDVCHTRRDQGLKVFNGAYIVSTNGHAMDKVEYLAEYVLTPMWGARSYYKDAVLYSESLADLHRELMLANGLGSFMAAQVIADLKYAPPLLNAPDWTSWAASGPGSRRGLNRVMERPVGAPWKESVWLSTLQDLHAQINPLVKKAEIPPIHAQDLQNCLCEFDKMERARLGEGRPKSLYPGKG